MKNSLNLDDQVKYPSGRHMNFGAEAGKIEN